MKYILIALLFVSCGRVEYVSVPGPKGDSGSQGIPGPRGSPAPTENSLEGYYVLPNGGYLDIYEDAQGLYTVRSARIVVTNSDGSTGVLPLSSIPVTAPFEGSLFYNSTQTYVALTHNVQNDLNSSDLVGSFLTELKFSKDSNGLMTIRVIVSNSTTVLFNHLITE